MELSWGTIVKTLNWTFIINLVHFAILLLVLNRILYRPMLRLFAERQARLQGRLKQAEERRRAAEELRAQREQELSRARAAARELLESARQQAAELLRTERARARREAREIVNRAAEEATREREQVQRELLAELGELAQLSVARILELETGAERGKAAGG